MNNNFVLVDFENVQTIASRFKPALADGEPDALA